MTTFFDNDEDEYMQDCIAHLNLDDEFIDFYDDWTKYDFVIKKHEVTIVEDNPIDIIDLCSESGDDNGVDLNTLDLNVDYDNLPPKLFS